MRPSEELKANVNCCLGLATTELADKIHYVNLKIFIQIKPSWALVTVTEQVLPLAQRCSSLLANATATGTLKAALGVLERFGART